MNTTKRMCNNQKCKKEYKADNRNLNRGWGLCCSKSCAAILRESKKIGYDEKTVKENNIRRAIWNNRQFPDNYDYETAHYETDIAFASEAHGQE
mgnify:CR=1 FL=1|tara:strand:+ start:263 stop:544 length:282 start_codon:yes stop_codon:yes gene_type:complete